jgi:hypothetical protein
VPPLYFLGDRLSGLEATIVERDDGTTAVEVAAVGTTTVELSDPSIEQLMLLQLLELQRIRLGMSLLSRQDLSEYSDL